MRRHRGSLATPWTQVRVAADDGAELAGWYAPAKRPNGDAVLVLHGVAADASVMVGLGGFLLDRGYDVLMPDFRAHGSSGGTLATYGILEVADLRRWVDRLLLDRPGRRVFGLGESMGAAILLEALPAEPRLCAAVAESPFADFRSIACDRISQALGLQPVGDRLLLRPPVAAGFLYARLRYGVDLDAVSPLRRSALSTTPILLIHGPEDRNIPMRHSRQIAALRRDAVLWEVPGAGHTAAHATCPREFEDRVVAFYTASARRCGPNVRSSAPGNGSP